MGTSSRATYAALAAFVLVTTSSTAQPEVAPPARQRGEDVYLAGPEVNTTQDVPGDLVAAGGTVRVGGSVRETAILAGGNVAVDGTVGDDVLAAGGDVVLRGTSRDDARLAGGSVRISGRVDDDAIAAGGTVRLDRDAVVGGRAWFAGGEVVVAGTVGRELRAAGGRVSISGTVRGDVTVSAESLEIGPTARIEGNVVHRGPAKPKIDPGARVSGTVEYRHIERRAARALAVLAVIFFVASLFATGVVMFLLFPRFSRAAAQTLETDPLRSLGVGALVLFGAPAAVLALLVTVIGIPLACVLLFAYLVALLAGYLLAALFLAMLGARRLGRPVPSGGAIVLGLLGALVVLQILQLVPFVGAVVCLAAILFGTGALILRLFREYRGATSAPPGPPR